MPKYAAVVYLSDEDGMYVTAVPDLPGCSALGAAYEDALREAQVAISLWIEAVKDIGSSIQQPAGELVVASS